MTMTMQSIPGTGSSGGASGIGAFPVEEEDPASSSF
jgi:hypothetical protein